MARGAGASGWGGGSGTGGAIGRREEYSKNAFDENGYYITDDEDGDWLTAPDKRFEKRLKKYTDSWEESEKTDGTDLKITGTPRQVEYARDIVRKYFAQYDKDEKITLKNANNTQKSVGERKSSFDYSRLVRGAKVWQYSKLKGREIRATSIIDAKDTLFPVARVAYSRNGAASFVSNNISKVIREYEAAQKKK